MNVTTIYRAEDNCKWKHETICEGNLSFNPKKLKVMSRLCMPFMCYLDCIELYGIHSNVQVTKVDQVVFDESCRKELSEE